MKKKIVANEKLLTYVLIGLILLVGLFYVVLFRPLAAEQAQKTTTLGQVQTTVANYETMLAKLDTERLTEAEAEALTAAIPVKPEVEQFIRDIEQMENSADTTVERIDFHPGAAVFEEKTEKDTGHAWRALFPEAVFSQLEEKIAEIEAINIAYVDVDMTMTGDEAEMHQFTEALKQLPRIVHIQHYDYKESAEAAEQWEGVVAVRIFYSEAFQAFVEREAD